MTSDIQGLSSDDVGRNVVYDSGQHQELGRLTSWDQTFVFVQIIGGFVDRSYWFRGPDGEACVPDDVTFESTQGRA